MVAEYQGKGHRLEISREQFEEATQDLLDRTRFTCVQALRAAGLEWSDLDRVLLVGGSTRMPMVRAMLQKLSGKSPDASVAADEAVAHGAALHAGLVLAKRDGRAAKFSIRNVNSHSLGVVGVDPQTKRRRNGIVIPRNTPLPVSAKRQFKTAKVGQRSILVQIVEGESPSADDCTPIGRCTVADLPPGLPAKSPVDVIFNYQSDGRLKVRVRSGDPEAPGCRQDRQLETEIVRENGLSKEHMDAWRRRICGRPPDGLSLIGGHVAKPRAAVPHFGIASLARRQRMERLSANSLRRGNRFGRTRWPHGHRTRNACDRRGDARRRRVYAAAKLFGPRKQLVGGNDHLRLQLEVQEPLVPDLAGHKVLRYEIQRHILVPRRRYRLHHGQRLVAVFDQADFARAVIDKAGGNGRDPDFVIVHVDQCPGRIAANRQSPLHAAALARAEQNRQKGHDGPHRPTFASQTRIPDRDHGRSGQTRLPTETREQGGRV